MLPAVAAPPQVDWFAPRPIWEFFSKFSIPKNQTKWTSRLKCNVYYYRTNYLAILMLALLAVFIRQPLSLVASALSILGLLCFNDPFTAAVKYVSADACCKGRGTAELACQQSPVQCQQWVRCLWGKRECTCETLHGW